MLRRSSRLAVFAAVALAALAAAPVATATVVSTVIDYGGFADLYVTGGAESNSIRLAAIDENGTPVDQTAGRAVWILVSDAAHNAQNPIAMGGACTRAGEDPPNVARCPYEGEPAEIGYGALQNLIVDTGAGDDFFDASNGGWLTFPTFEGGPGNDTLIAPDGTDASGGPGDDRLTGGPGIDWLDGGGGSDTLIGEGADDSLNGSDGSDTVRAGEGDDTVVSRDDSVDDVDCGGGLDQLTGDLDDAYRNCETLNLVQRPVQDPDQDDDGSPRTVDCVDTDPSIFPGAPERPGNGKDDDCRDGDAAPVDADRDGAWLYDGDPLTVDDCRDDDPAVRPSAPEVPANGKDDDCVGGDAPNVDRDGDGAPAATDCDDNDRRRQPGAFDVPGNDRDEDCTGADAVLRSVLAAVAPGFSTRGSRTRVRRLQVRSEESGVKVELRCRGRGCPFTRRSAGTLRSGRTRDLRSRLRGTWFRAGSVLEVRLTKPYAIAVVYRITFRDRGRLPVRRTLCLKPSARTPRTCA